MDAASAESDGEPYTLAVWWVKAGEEAAFLEAWRGLVAIFGALPSVPHEAAQPRCRSAERQRPHNAISPA